MPEYRAPGVYVEEHERAPAPIEGADISTAAFVGIAELGETNVAVAVESAADFARRFGAPAPDTPMARAVEQFFANGGRRALVVRVPAVDGRAEAAAIIGDAAEGSGLAALARGDAPGLVLTPDAASLPESESAAVAAAALRLCEQVRAFHVFDAPREASPSVASVIAWAARSDALRSSYGAVYYPWLVADDPAAPVPPSAAVAGLIARTDAEAGVWKAPAGADRALLAVSGLAPPPRDAEIATLQTAGVNALRSRDGIGIFPWGARTFLAPDDTSPFKYVPVRRTALFLERSLAEGLRWAAFEPMDEDLWGRVRLAASSFLDQMFRTGAFRGTTPPEAYFVRCGRDTMTEDDIASGRLVVVVGIAALKPAEFVVLRIGLES
jgi:phage tail sheath protein FI